MSNPSAGALLVVDSSGKLRPGIETILSDYYFLTWASTLDDALDILDTHADIDAVVMSPFDDPDESESIVRQVKSRRASLPIVFYSETAEGGSSDRTGASWFVRSVRNAVESHTLTKNPRVLIDLAEQEYKMIGNSPAMLAVYELIRKISRTNSKAMILGETGTGKELVARAIHATSVRREMRFAILNCYHKSPELVESELFGHTRGSFTGAVNDRPGIFEYANGGTLLLDEIGDLDLSTQTKLLRVLETGEYQKVGSEEMKKTEIRLLCATHMNLENMVAERKFRQDLYYRLKGVTIYMPPLRERREDIIPLVEKTTRSYARRQTIAPKYFDSRALDILVNYDWPGNVRQLIDTVESLIVLADSDMIVASDVTEYLGLDHADKALPAQALTDRVRQFERAQIINTLRQTDYNISAAARALRIDRTNLRRKMKLYAIDSRNPAIAGG